MRTKINILSLSVFSLLFIGSFFTSCSKDDGDTTPPVIKLIEPEEGDVLKIGADIHFDMELSDNEMLKSYRVEIHENMSKPHDHKSVTRADETKYFSFDKTWTLNTKNAKIHHHEIIIPENATPGNYHLMVYCLDAVGNQTHVARNIVLSHDGEEHEHEHDH